MTTGKAPSGRAIWRAVRDELRLNLYPLPFSTVAPAVYHVYLHPEDFAAIEGVTGRLADQLRTALTEEVERANREKGGAVRTWLARLLEREELPPIEVPPSGWEVHVRPDPNDELTRGQLGIVSTLALPPTPAYGGTPTTRIVRSVVGEGGRSSSVTEAPAPAGNAGASAGHEDRRPGEPPRAVVTTARSQRDRARLTYHDDDGAHVFVMRKDTVSIGRGGSAAWVDVQVVTGAKVSREHVRLRIDDAGRGFVQDVSLWGTTVDGEPIPPAVKTADGVAGPGPEHPLPRRARITLAGAVTIEFETLEAP